MNEEILIIQEVAELLKVADKTVCSMAQKGELPAFKVRGQWRLRRQDIDGWISESVARGSRALSPSAKAAGQKRKRRGGRV
jgi:excisionase family DNA binding protein